MLRIEPAIFSPLVNALLKECQERGKTVAAAESCTGGLVATLMTHFGGSSAVFTGGVVAYSNEVKIGVLGVGRDVIARNGAVSQEVAEAMALGARRVLTADYAIAITGVAGPDGGSKDKPVGTVWTAFAGPDGVKSELLRLSGDRASIRTAAAQFSLDRLLKIVQSMHSGGIT